MFESTLQILPDLDPSCAKKRLELVVKELEFTPQGEGNEMVMSRAMELLMNLEGGYPKRQIGLTLSSSDEDSEEEDIEISENEDEGEVENVRKYSVHDLPNSLLSLCLNFSPSSPLQLADVVSTMNSHLESSLPAL